MDNIIEMHEVNNFLLCVEGLFRVAYISTAGIRDELFQKGLLESSDPLHIKQENTLDNPIREEAGKQFQAKNYDSVEFTHYLLPELAPLLRAKNVHAVITKNNANDKVVVWFDKREKAKMDEIKKQLTSVCQNFQLSRNEHHETPKKMLDKINATMDGAETKVIKNLSDFQYHMLCEKLPEYKVPFSGEIIRDGMHQIYYSSADIRKILDCVHDTVDYLATPEGKEEMKKFKAEQKVISNIEDKIKNNETVYVVSSGEICYIKIEPEKLTFLEERPDGRLIPMNLKENPIEGKVFRDKPWLTLTQSIIDMKSPVNINQQEFEQFINTPYLERETIVENKMHEMINEIELEERNNSAPIVTNLDIENNENDRGPNTIDELE